MDPDEFGEDVEGDEEAQEESQESHILSISAAKDSVSITLSKATIISRMLAFEKFLLGMDYSQANRLNIYKGGSADCSSLQGAAMSFAGFPLLDANGNELLVSNTEVYAQGFNLVYPSSAADIGKVLPSNASVENNLQPGDIVFFNFNGSTGRANKITHIGAVLDSGHLIQTCNNTVKCSTYTIPWGATRICAIIRLKDNVVGAARPNLQINSGPRYAVRMLQAILNYELGAKLKWDGVFGTATQTALKQFQQKVGLPVTGIVTNVDWTYLFKENVTPTPPPIPPPVPPTPSPVPPSGPVYTRLIKVTSPYMRGNDVTWVQQRLVYYGYLKANQVDGVYGPLTAYAVKSFQRVYALSMDSIIGPKTWAALKK